MELMSKQAFREAADETFKRLCEVWDDGLEKAKTDQSSFLPHDYWKTGNTVDAVINYMVITNTPDTKKRIKASYDYVYSKGKYPSHWRDDYGWWGNAFVNAIRADHAKILGLDTAEIQAYKSAAEECWEKALAANADANQKYVNKPENIARKQELLTYGGGYAVWNNDGIEAFDSDRSIRSVPNSVTNLGFWVLSIGLYEITKEQKYFAAMQDAFRWFYNLRNQKPKNLDESMLLNKSNLIRETANPWSHTQKWCYDTNRAWTADQGALLYCLWKSMKYIAGADLQKEMKELFATVKDGFVTVNGNSKNSLLEKFVLHEFKTLPVPDGYDPNVGNFNDNYCTGPGVLMRYIGLIDAPTELQKFFAPGILMSGVNAWANRDKDPELPKDIKNQILCWYAPIRETAYKDFYLKDNDGDNPSIWYFALQTAGLDVLTSALRLLQQNSLEQLGLTKELLAV